MDEVFKDAGIFLVIKREGYFNPLVLTKDQAKILELILTSKEFGTLTAVNAIKLKIDEPSRTK